MTRLQCVGKDFFNKVRDLQRRNSFLAMPRLSFIEGFREGSTLLVV